MPENMKTQIVNRLIALGDSEPHATHLYEYYKEHDDLEILLRTIEARETPKPVDTHVYHNY